MLSFGAYRLLYIILQFRWDNSHDDDGMNGRTGVSAVFGDAGQENIGEDHGKREKSTALLKANFS